MPTPHSPNIRYLTKHIQEDLKSKMVFLGGPRQVGKTTLALSLLSEGSKTHPAYLNWDIKKHRPPLLQHEIPSGQDLIILDEIHKYKKWRQLLKGLFDEYVPECKFLITGSARLDYYRKGGDSLLGRYFHYRLHPFSLSEIDRSGGKDLTLHLLQLGGFPEPYTKGSRAFWARWNRSRVEQILSEDLRDLEQVKEISLLELLIESLPERITSPLSLANLAKLLEVSPDSVSRWIQIFERLYLCFRVSPYGDQRIKSVKKEQKLYFWDWAYAPEGGARFENMVACHLLKYCHYLEDTEGCKMELRYLRDINGREVDFVVLRDKKPLFAVECKLSERAVSPAIEYFSKRTKIPHFYQVHLDNSDYLAGNKSTRVLPFWIFSKEISLR